MKKIINLISSFKINKNNNAKENFQIKMKYQINN